MSLLDRLIDLLGRCGPTIGTAAIAAVLQRVGQHPAAVAASLAALLFAAVAMIDTCDPRS